MALVAMTLLKHNDYEVEAGKEIDEKQFSKDELKALREALAIGTDEQFKMNYAPDAAAEIEALRAEIAALKADETKTSTETDEGKTSEDTKEKK